MTTVVGDTIGIPDSIMGLTFLAAGGNMPEIASIVILARQGNKLDFLLFLSYPIKISYLLYWKIKNTYVSYIRKSLLVE